MKKTFEAKLEAGRFTYLELPFDASNIFKIPKGKITVTGSINNLPYRKSLLSKGHGKYLLPLNKDILKKLNVLIGDEVKVVMELAEKPVENLNYDDYLDVKSHYRTAEEKLAAGEELNIFEALFTRRSIRAFTEQKVSDEDIDLLIKAGCYAPSAENKQPWEFVVIKDLETRRRISEEMPRAKMLRKANCCIVVCGDKNRETQTGFLVEDCAAVLENVLLAAHGLGLGAVWCGLYPISKYTKSIRNLLKIPDDVIPIGMVAIGHTNEKKKMVYRPYKDRIHYESWHK